MNAEGAARELLGSSWAELEAAADELIARGRRQVSRWVWIKQGETLWETPLAMAGDEDPMRVLRAEPSPQDRRHAITLGYDSAERVIAARYYTDHWEGPDGCYQRGVTLIDAVTIDSTLLRFVHQRRGPHAHRVRLVGITVADRDVDGRLLETRSWGSEHGRQSATRTSYDWHGKRLRRTVTKQFDGGLEDGELRKVMRLGYDYDEAGLLRVRWHQDFDRYDDEPDSGVAWYRRSPKAEREARRLIRTELPRRIQAWAARVAPDEPVYGLGLVYSFEAPELPPALGLGTLRELRQWRRQHSDRLTFRSYAFNPAEFEHFASVPEELVGDPALNDAIAVLNQAWQASETEREPRSTLLACARSLMEVDWPVILKPADDFVIFVVEDEIGDDHARQLRSTIPADVLSRLESSDA